MSDNLRGDFLTHTAEK